MADAKRPKKMTAIALVDALESLQRNVVEAERLLDAEVDEVDGDFTLEATRRVLAEVQRSETLTDARFRTRMAIARIDSAPWEVRSAYRNARRKLVEALGES